MNYSDIINALNTATAFDLFRIKAAIDQMLDDPQLIRQLKDSLKIGQSIEYFDPNENRAIQATVTAFKRTKICVEHDDGARWTIPYFWINIHKVDTTISGVKKDQGLHRNEVKVGDKVGFLDNQNVEHYGEIIRLNQKTVTLICNRGQWRVSYTLLFKVISPEMDLLPSA